MKIEFETIVNLLLQPRVCAQYLGNFYAIEYVNLKIESMIMIDAQP